MKNKLLKNIFHIIENIIYYCFYPISIIAIIKYKRDSKKRFSRQTFQLESYKIFKEKENSSYLNKDNNKE